MRIWSIGWNTQFKTASLHLEQGPWWLLWLTSGVCTCWIPKIPFPSWLYITDKEDGQRYSWKAWYGDLSQWATCEIEMPLSGWAFKRIECHTVDIDFEKAKTDYPKDWESITKMEAELENAN